MRTDRRTSAFLAATAVFALVAAPAIAETPERHTVDGVAAGLTLRLPGVGTLEAGRTSVVSDDVPTVNSAGIGIANVPGGDSSAAADGASEATSDPADGGSNCATPALPNILAGLGLGAACSNAQASLLNGPAGSATSAVGKLSIDGSVLADAIIDLLLAPVNDAITPLGDQIEGAVTTLQEAVLTDVIEELTAQCTVVAGAVPIADVLLGVGGILDQIGLPSGADELAALGEPCVVLAAIINDVPLVGDGELPDLIALIAQALKDALGGVPLLDVSLGGSETILTSDGTTISVVSTASGITISSASLAGLVDAITDVLLDALDLPFIGRLTDLLATLDDVPVIPTLDDALATVLSLLDLPLLNLDEPLITLEAAKSVAMATRDRAADSYTASGTPASVAVTLSSALADLLGADPSVSVAAGQTVAILSGTPLESIISVGDVQEFSDEVDGQAGGGVNVSGVSLSLFTGLPEGGIGVGVGNANATARGAAGTAPVDPPPPLPTTGGGLVLLGLLSVAGARGLRRDG